MDTPHVPYPPVSDHVDGPGETNAHHVTSIVPGLCYGWKILLIRFKLHAYTPVHHDLDHTPLVASSLPRAGDRVKR